MSQSYCLKRASHQHQVTLVAPVPNSPPSTSIELPRLSSSTVHVPRNGQSKMTTIITDHTVLVLLCVDLAIAVLLIVLCALNGIRNLRRARDATNAWNTRLERLELGSQDRGGTQG